MLGDIYTYVYVSYLMSNNKTSIQSVIFNYGAPPALDTRRRHVGKS